MNTIIIIILFFICVSFAGEDVSGYVMHHLSDSDKWRPFPGIEIPLFSNIFIKNMDMSVSLHVLMLIIASLIIFLVFGIIYKKRSDKAPQGITNLLEVMVVFIRDEICIEYLGEKDGRRLCPWFLNFFFLILFLNLMGLIPLFSTATANVNVTMGLAFITLAMMVIGGIAFNGLWGFVRLFFPPGIPWPIYFVLFPIEFMGLFIKPFALTIRLFANMLGGHIVIFSLLGLIITFKWAGMPSIVLALFIILLEVLVAFIQSYIFTFLSAMFVGSFLHPHH